MTRKARKEHKKLRNKNVLMPNIIFLIPLSAFLLFLDALSFTKTWICSANTLIWSCNFIYEGHFTQSTMTFITFLLERAGFSCSNPRRNKRRRCQSPSCRWGWGGTGKKKKTLKDYDSKDIVMTPRCLRNKWFSDGGTKKNN